MGSTLLFVHEAPNYLYASSTTDTNLSSISSSPQITTSNEEVENNVNVWIFDFTKTRRISLGILQRRRSSTTLTSDNNNAKRPSFSAVLELKKDAEHVVFVLQKLGRLAYVGPLLLSDLLICKNLSNQSS